MCIKHIREWQLKFYKEESNRFLAFQHCTSKKSLWFVVLWLCPALIRGLRILDFRIVSINAVSFDFHQLPYEHAHRFLMYPRLLNTCVTKSQLT